MSYPIVVHMVSGALIRVNYPNKEDQDRNFELIKALRKTGARIIEAEDFIITADYIEFVDKGT